MSEIELNQSVFQAVFANTGAGSSLTIRAEVVPNIVTATLLDTGAVVLNGSEFNDIHAAMNHVPHRKNSTSTPWQFWTYYSEEREAWTPLEHLRARFASKSVQNQVRTSDSHPLRIDAVSVPGCAGRIGMTFCPGKQDSGLYGGTWRRDLGKDFAVIARWGAGTLVSLMEDHEFSALGVPQFADTVKQQSFRWLHLPIRDMQIPDVAFEQRWRTIGPELRESLASGESIVIHCRGGLGRTGLLAARLLVESGLTPVDAVARVRSARAHSIETYAQEHYILTQAWQID